MDQILLGAALPFLIAAVIYAWRGCRASLPMLILTPVWMVFGALWAIAPDLPRLAGHYELYHRLSRDPRMDIFFFHYTIDRLEIDSPLYHAGLVLMFVLLLGAALREIRKREGEA